LKNPPGIASVLHLKEAESTQTLARELAEQGAEDKTLVWADRQTKGRGRMARRWSSPMGGLYFTLILRPRFPPARLADFSLMAGEAAARALSRLARIETIVKAPNDVLTPTPRGPRKLCGILSEASGGARGLDWLVLGIGVNVNAAPAGAASLRSASGKAWDVEAVLRAVLRRFLGDYDRFAR
jgi:BirA family transcriptional regulator, biotin operon repressor / biotin---[acetyl-CoA-carboxylase] ligase